MKRPKNLSNSKRRSIKTLAVGLTSATSLAVWHRPIINSIILPAHAQTSGSATNIIASSSDANNPFSRFVLIVDSSDTVLANCGASGGIASASGLAAGTYRFFADSNGPQTQIIEVTAGDSTRRITVSTTTGTCNFLIATIDLPSGNITAANGEQLSVPWSCNTNSNTGCS
jgi:hypothetical protein